MTTTRYENARDALQIAPDLIEHIVSLIPIKSKPGEDDVRSKRVTPPLPLNEGAFNDGNELYGRITHWAQFWGDTLRVPTPGVARRAWRNRSGIVGLPFGIEPAEAREQVSVMTMWLASHLDEIFRRTPDDVAIFTAELNEIHQAAARYPTNGTPRWTSLACRIVGCPGQVALYPFTTVQKWTEEGKHLFLPPEGARVLCAECSDQWTQHEYDDEVKRRVLAAKEQQRADRVRARLMKKYQSAATYPILLGTVAGKVHHDDQ